MRLTKTHAHSKATTNARDASYIQFQGGYLFSAAEAEHEVGFELKYCSRFYSVLNT